jgi:integration host factor subunit beta
LHPISEKAFQGEWAHRSSFNDDWGTVVVIKSQLTLNVAGQFFHLPHRVVEKAVDVVLDEIVTAMARKDRVELRGFGAFSVKDRAGRIGRNPKSGVKVEVPQKSLPAFKPSKEIGRRLNPVASIPESSERTSRRSR